MSPVVFSITAAQLEALRKPITASWRTIGALYAKKLVTDPDPRQTKLTPLGKAICASL